MVISEREMKGVVDIARANGVWVLQDSINRGLEWGGGLSPTVADYYEKGVTTGGLTKALGVTGLRIGWIICRDKAFISNCNAIQTYVNLCTSWPGEVLAMKLLEPETFKRITEEGKDIGRKNLPIFENWLSKHQSTMGWVRPKGSFLGFPRYDYDISSWDLCEELSSSKIVLGPGVGFMTERHIRIGFGIETDLFTEGLNRLDNLMDELDKEVPMQVQARMK